MSRGPLHAGAALAAALLAGCGADTAELQAWMDRERQAASAPALPPLALPAPATSVPLVGELGQDPFDPQRLAPASAAASVPSGVETALDPGRPREPLEAFPLESLRMVGSLEREGHTLALVQAPGALFTVQVGERLGRQGGRVTRITETAITLRERVRDAGGAWSERGATLELQETAR
jgi:type IV pilus assembly protein PilP